MEFSDRTALSVGGDPVGAGVAGASVLGEFVETVVGASTGAAVSGDPVGAGVGASVLGEFVETVVGESTGAAVGGGDGAAMGTAVGAATTGGVKVGGGTGDGFTTPVEGVGPPPLLLLLLVKTTATTTATTVPNPNSNSGHGPNHVLAEYQLSADWRPPPPASSSSQGSVAAASSQGFGVSVDGDSFGKWNDGRILAVSNEYCLWFLLLLLLIACGGATGLSSSSSSPCLKAAAAAGLGLPCAAAGGCTVRTWSLKSGPKSVVVVGGSLVGSWRRRRRRWGCTLRAWSLKLGHMGWCGWILWRHRRCGVHETAAFHAGARILFRGVAIAGHDACFLLAGSLLLRLLLLVRYVRESNDVRAARDEGRGRSSESTRIDESMDGFSLLMPKNVN